VILAPGTAFPGASSSKRSDFLDGPENTILVTEIANSDIPWLQPRDLDATQMSFRINDPARPSISAVQWRYGGRD
jgi:hypothetical protein